MKIHLSFFFTLAIMLGACSKQEIGKQPLPVKQFPEMLITELNDAAVTDKQAQRLDLDQDGTADLLFSTWNIGNPNQHEDELLFFAASGTGSALFVGDHNNSPVYNKRDILPVLPARGYDWYIVSQVEMAMRNTGYAGDPYWEKAWKDASHQFLQVRVARNNGLYYGWVEVSMDKANSMLILHRSGISKIPGRAVKAGE